ncbi:SOUL family heme-binding protein [Mycolicibacter arupensis]|uniref:SOUL family heme-binding protein n=1 Tax=Mycolicibacter arupensis TaxID=342002 RepID=UPI00122CF57F|nr:heme-binding protein [Mycolicibacter arupensis]KAA1430109.1 heme-binding protein [Mycolicibacter arupensis]
MSGILSAAGAALAGVGSVVGVRNGTEEPPFTVQRRTPDVQIRRYAERVAAETVVDGDEEAARSTGFRRLAGYIFGGNHSGTKIAMTAPVAQDPAAPTGEKISMTAPVAQQSGAPGQWVIRFFMPTGVDLESLPEPDNALVKLVRVPAETVAVHTFSGDRGSRAVERHTATLLNALKDLHCEPVGIPQAWFYDPPWTLPMFRRNEIAVTVTQID